VILRLTKYDFLLGSLAIFPGLAISLPLVSTVEVCHSSFYLLPNLNYCSDPFTEHRWRCSKRVFGMVEECRRMNEMSPKGIGILKILFCL